MTSIARVGQGVALDPATPKTVKGPVPQAPVPGVEPMVGTYGGPGAMLPSIGGGQFGSVNPGMKYPKPPGTGGADPGVAQTPFQKFGPGSNLIGTQINPVGSYRSQTAGAMTDRAAAGLQGFQFSPFQTMGPADTGESRAVLGQAQGTVGGMTLPQYQQVAGTDLSGATQTLGQARGFATPSDALRGAAGAGAVGSFGYSGDTGSVRGAAVGQLNSLLNTTPDRAKLAADAYQLLLERSQPGEQIEDRRLAQKTAALGRVGSGMFNSEQMDLATARERTRDQARRELATNAAGLSLSDARDKLLAAQGLSGELAGQDTAAGGLNLGYNQLGLSERDRAFGRMSGLDDRAFRNLMDISGRQADYAGIQRGDALTERGARREAEDAANAVRMGQGNFYRGISGDLYGRESDAWTRARGERDAARGDEYDQFGVARSRLGDLSDYERGILGEERSGRNELRGERDYQYGLDRDALGDRERQFDREQGVRGREFDDWMRMAEFGYGTNPAGAYAAAGARRGADAASYLGDIGPQFLEWARSRQQRNGSAGDPPLAMEY